MWTGGTLGTGLSYDDFFLAVLLGNLMLGLYTAILGFIGARTGLSTHLLAHYSFGSKGSWLPSALLGGTQVGWFGVGVAMFAIPVAKATGLDVNLLILVSGALMTLTVFFGIAGLTLLSAIAVPAIVVLGSYSVWLAVRDAGGLAALQQVTPSAPLSLSTAIALVVGSFVSAGTLTADFVRFGRSARTAVVVCLVAFFLGNSLMFIFGVRRGGGGQVGHLRRDDRPGPADPGDPGPRPEHLDHQRQRAVCLRPRLRQHHRPPAASWRCSTAPSAPSPRSGCATTSSAG